MERFISFLALSIVGISFSGCLSEQELAERARQTALNNFKIELCADEPSRWKPALKKLFTLVDQKDPDGIDLFLDLTNTRPNKYSESLKDEKWSEVVPHRNTTASTKVTGKFYYCSDGGCKKLFEGNYYCPGHFEEWRAFVSHDCEEEISKKFWELAQKNVPFATRVLANCAVNGMFRYWQHDHLYNHDGYCIKDRFWCKWGMWLIDNKSEGARKVAFDFAWRVGNSKFSNKGISSGWGDSDFEGVSNIESYAEKFFTEFAEKGDSEALSDIFWGLTTKPETGSWKYDSRALDVLKNLALAGNKDAISYLIRIMNKESAQSYKSSQETNHHFIALQYLVEIQKKTPSTLIHNALMKVKIHNALMKVKNETTDTDVYEYIETNYQ